MRNKFGRFALELRAKKGISLRQFSSQVGLSPQRVCNIEFGRASATDEIVGAYIKVLDLKGGDAHELRTLAAFNNNLKRFSSDEDKHPPLRALFETLVGQLSPSAAAEIEKILERETGRTVKSLAFSSNKSPAGKSRSRKQGRRPMPTPKRFAEICLLAEELRSQVARETSAVDIGLSLEKLCSVNSKLDYCVVERLPSYMEGAFACIVGELDGHTLFVEEKRFISAENGVLFARHVIAHELAHHYLHPDLLASDQRTFLSPQGLSRNSPELIDTDGQIEQVVDTIVEAEAELFATMFLVPWVAYLKGTSPYYLSKDYGEQPREVERYVNFFKNPSVVNALREALWNRGVRRHVIFGG